MTPRLIPLLCISVLAFAACGGEDESSGNFAETGKPNKEESAYRDKLDAACKVTYDATVPTLAAIQSLLISDAERKDRQVVRSKLERSEKPFFKLGGAVSELHNALRKTEAPDGTYGETAKEYIANVGSASAQLLTVGDAAAKRQLEGYTIALDSYGRIQQKLRKQARLLDFKVCSRR